MKLIRLALLLLSTFGYIYIRAQCPKLVWSDEFEGNSLDLQKWSHQTGGGGWGNNELQNYRPENATVADGFLKITAKRENLGGNAYTSSRIRTINKADFTYGRMEARIKLPYGQGIWPAFWMMPTDDKYGGWPKSGEIDIMEYIGREPKKIYGTLHFGPDWPNNKSTGGSYNAHREDFSKEFHVFAVEWEANEIRWYIDDYLYSTKKTSDLGSERWPFDQRFHFILNLAVGGNWPGSPDGSTVFPQVMEVDYVRVYDKGAPSISGPNSVPFQAPFTVYTLSGVEDNAKITWQAPPGAEISSGQGSKNVAIKWGNNSGDLKAEVETACGKKTLTVYVKVEPGLAKEKGLENFDENSPLQLVFMTGSFTDNFANPNPGGINNSALVGKYVRNAGSQYDVMVYQGRPIADVTPFLNKERKFFIDVYTNAPLGTEILFQAENAARSQQNYPTGRHSRFQAFTTKQNEWERLELAYLDRPDGGTASTAIDQYVLLFKPNTFSNHTYHFDNLDAYAPIVSGVKEALIDAQKVFQLSPNPAIENLWLENVGEDAILQSVLLSLDGKILQSSSAMVLPQQKVEWKVQGLAPGVYIMQVLREDGKMAVRKWVKW